MLEQIQAAAQWISTHTTLRPTVAIVLGTGLGRLAEEIEVIEKFSYADIPHFPVSTVEGHSGCLLFGRLGGKEVLAMQGRFHYYEGYDMKQVTFPIRVMYELGIKTLFVSNASGGLSPEMRIGDMMFITDHINFFPDMSEAYDHKLLELARTIAKEKQLRYVEGVYVGTSGPTFETPAEYKMYRVIGGDAVGMSTVPEVIVARHCGIRVFGISIITDLGVEGKIQEVSHEEVQEAANAVQPLMADIMREMIVRSC